MSVRPVQTKFHIKRGDTVQVIRGEASGQQGKVLQVMRASSRAVVEGFEADVVALSLTTFGRSLTAATVTAIVTWPKAPLWSVTRTPSESGPL